MNTLFFLNMKNTIVNSGKIFFSEYKSTMKAAITGLMLISFASVLIVGCSDNNGGAKKTNPDTQSNGQRGEGEGERGMGDDKRGMDSNHRGMGHAPNGMDTIHRGKHK